MDLQLQPPAGTCFISGATFKDGDHVVSFLVRDESGEFRRFDCLASAEGGAAPAGEILCRWTRISKTRPSEVNADRELRLSAESLFLSMTDDGTGPVEENGQLKQFLALMLERKRVLKNRGLSVGGNQVFEHMRSKRMLEVPAGEMSNEFFMSVREKLGVLLGERPTAGAPPATGPAPIEP